MYIQTLIRVLLLMCGVAVVSAAQPYRRQFDDQWKKADEIVREHHQSWEAVFTSLDADSRVCEAIVFPEVLRWSRLRNTIEQATLNMFYIRNGKEGADFSIGLFQMKPSFAEKIEKAWMKSPLRHKYQLYFVNTDDEYSRRQRLERLNDEEWQCVYLALFIRLLLEREPSLAEKEPVELIRLMATAYNRDFEAGLDELERYSRARTFHLDLIPGEKTEYLSYSELSVGWYIHNINRKL